MLTMLMLSGFELYPRWVPLILEALGLVCNALVREIFSARRNCFSRKLLTNKEICFKFINAMFKLGVCRADAAEAEG